jgi:hypothetical protein
VSGKSARLKQRIFHPGNLLLHGPQGVTDHSRTHTLGAQVTKLFDLQEVKKGIEVFNGKQASFFPASQLSRRNAKDS